MFYHPPLGIFGGTFDPIHNGHIQPTIEAAHITGIKNVAMMPCHVPTHKGSAHVSSAHRLNMVEQLCSEYPLFYPDDRDIKRNKPTYSVDSLTSFREEFPHTPLCFFIGTDSLVNFCTWYQWQKILSLCHLVVCHRVEKPKTPQNTKKVYSAELECLLKQRQVSNPEKLHQSLAGQIYLAPTKALTISSTKLRKKLNQQQDVTDFIPESVMHYIHQHKLYQAE